MFWKAGESEAAKRLARRGPDGMVKAGLLEPQCPNLKHRGRERRMSQHERQCARANSGLTQNCGNRPVATQNLDIPFV
jgi:hypothetical protein